MLTDGRHWKRYQRRDVRRIVLHEFHIERRKRFSGQPNINDSGTLPKRMESDIQERRLVAIYSNEPIGIFSARFLSPDGIPIWRKRQANKETMFIGMRHARLARRFCDNDHMCDRLPTPGMDVATKHTGCAGKALNATGKYKEQNEGGYFHCYLVP